jgi:uncharacterized membrane protein
MAQDQSGEESNQGKLPQDVTGTSANKIKPPSDDLELPPSLLRASTSNSMIESDPFTGSSDFSVTTQFDVPDTNLIAMGTSFEGPLPPPSYLKGYEEVVPGSGKEIISWVREESKHRRNMELKDAIHRQSLETAESLHRRQLETRSMDLGEKALKAGIFRANTGMFLAWPLMFGVVLSGSLLVYAGHDSAGTFIVESGLTLVAGTYVLNKITQWRMLREKTKLKIEEDGEEEEPSKSVPS